jgi:hypothetical protein
MGINFRPIMIIFGDCTRLYNTVHTQGLCRVGEVPTKRSSDNDPIMQHCRTIGHFGLRSKIVG